MVDKICIITDSVFSLGGIQRVVTDFANAFCNSAQIDIICLNRVNSKNRVDYGLSDSINTFEFRNTKNEDLIMLPIRVLNVILGKIKIPSTYKKMQLQLNYLRFSFRNKRLFNYINSKEYNYVIATGLNNCILLSKYKKYINDKTELIGWWHSSYMNYIESGDYPYKYILKSLKELNKTVVLTKNDQYLIKRNFNINVFQIYNPIDFEIRRKFKDKNIYKRLIAVGRYHPIKQFDKAIDAYYYFYKSFSDKSWVFDIIGEGSQYKKLKSQIEKRDLTNNVHLYGKTNNMLEEYDKSSIMIITSLSEGLPTVVLEAMQHGIPVVGFKIPVLEEILPMANVTLVEQNDIINLSKVIEFVINDTKLREKIYREYQNKINDFNIKKIIEEWKEKILNK